MEKEDGRKLPPEAQHERRKQALRLHQKGKSWDEISSSLSMGHVTARAAVKKATEQGVSALKPKPRGRKLGDKRQLSAAQELSIQKQICEHRPEQLKLTFALWTRRAVALLIEQECGLVLPVRTVGEYLKRWGFTPQRPMIRAYEQKPEAVKAWLDDEYPKIAQRAKAENAEIHWGDETALVNTDVRGRGFQPKGQTPIAYAVGGKREKLSMIATVTNQGKSRWMIIDGNFDSERFIEFLEALIKDSERKIFLIVDNLRVHHSKLVKAWAAEHVTQIELFYLPSYSPDLNPEERLNADLKYAIGSKVAVRTKTKLTAAANEHMGMLGKNPERVKSYFQDKRVKYAA
jgi:transposase